MMLPTGDPLGTVVTMLATPFGRLDGLAIDTAGAGGWRPTGSPPDSPSEGVIDGLPGSVSFPRRKVVVDGPPWGKIVGQRSPDTAIAVAVEDGINHGSHLGLAWPPTGAGRRQEGLQDSPLLACQITGVWLRVHTLSTFETPLLEQTLRVFFGLELVREVESQLAEPPAQGLAGNPQPAGGLMLIPTRVFQDAGEQEAVDLAVGLRIKVACEGAEAAADEHLEAGIFRRGLWRRLGSARLVLEGGQEGREQSRAAGVQECLLEHALQLTDVSGPGVAAQTLERL